MITCPGRAKSSSPSDSGRAPSTTDSTALLSGSDSSTTSVPSHTSPSASAGTAPTDSACPARTSYPTTRTPAATSRRVMRPPMFPSPTNPTCRMPLLLPPPHGCAVTAAIATPAAHSRIPWSVRSLVQCPEVPGTSAAGRPHRGRDARPAVHGHDLSGHGGHLVGQRERDHRRDLVRRPGPAQRRGRGPAHHVFPPGGGEQCGRHDPRGHGVHPDPGWLLAGQSAHLVQALTLAADHGPDRPSVSAGLSIVVDHRTIWADLP